MLNIFMASDQNDSGFILLSALWILVLGGALAAAVLVEAHNSTRALDRARATIALDLALRSARDQALADMIVNGSRSRWARTGSGTFNVDDVTVAVTSSDESGRLDLIAATPDRLDALFASLDVPAEARGAARSSLEAFRKLDDHGRHDLRKPRTIAALAAHGQWSEQIRVCLEPEVTIYTGLAQPLANAMSGTLRRILQTDAGSRDVSDETVSLAGSVYRLGADATLNNSRHRLQWAVRLTGNPREPVWILSTQIPLQMPKKTDCWRHLPAAVARPAL